MNMKIAVFEKGQYYKGEVVNNKIFAYRSSKDFSKVGKRWNNISITEELLESFNIPNLGYIETEDGFKLFDKSKVTYSEEELPVYIDYFGTPRNTGKWTTIKTLTREALDASELMLLAVRKELFRMEHKKELEDIAGSIEKGKGIAYIEFRDPTKIYEILSHIPNARVLCEVGYTGYIIGSEAKSHQLELHVPEKLIPFVIGKNGRNIKSIAQCVGATYIKVTAL